MVGVLKSVRSWTETLPLANPQIGLKVDANYSSLVSASARIAAFLDKGQNTKAPDDLVATIDFRPGAVTPWFCPR